MCKSKEPWFLIFFSFQAFIHALLSTVVSLQKFNFFTVCLVQRFRGVSPWYTPKEKYLKCRSADCWKMHFFFFIFLGILSFMGSFEEKLTRKMHTTLLYACFKLCKPKSKLEKQVNRMENLSRVF